MRGVQPDTIESWFQRIKENLSLEFLSQMHLEAVNRNALGIIFSIYIQPTMQELVFGCFFTIKRNELYEVGML
jgi:hypothetical protein